MSTEGPVAGCDGCYSSFSGWWCDNCDQWPCICTPGEDPAQEAEAAPELITREFGVEYYGDWVKIDFPSGPTVLVFAEMDWHYGPNEGGDQDPGKMWHTGCGQEVHVIDGVHICGCGQDAAPGVLELAQRIAELIVPSTKED